MVEQLKLEKGETLKSGTVDFTDFSFVCDDSLAMDLGDLEDSNNRQRFLTFPLIELPIDSIGL